MILPGPTGESNRLTSVQRVPLLCLGPGAATAMEQARLVRELGGEAVEAPGLAPEALTTLDGFSGALHWARSRRSARSHAPLRAAGPILPLSRAPMRPMSGWSGTLHRHDGLGRQRQLLAEVGKTA